MTPFPWLSDIFRKSSALEDLSSIESECERIIKIEIAHLNALRSQTVISDAVLKAACCVLENTQISLADAIDHAAADGVIIPYLVEHWRQNTNTDTGQWIHFGLTSQDIVDTSFMLFCQSVIQIIDAKCSHIIKEFGALDEKFGNRTINAHTRLQIALPIAVSELISSWLRPIQATLVNLENWSKHKAQVQLGGPIGDCHALIGQGVNISMHREDMAKELGLSAAQTSWHTDRHTIREFANHLVSLSSAMGKIGMDIGLLSQNEIGAIKLEGGGSSSAMQHKSNPIAAEIIVSHADIIAGYANTLNATAIHEYQRSGMKWTIEWYILPQITQMSLSQIKHLLDITSKLSFVETVHEI